MKFTQPMKNYGLVILFSLVLALHGCAAKGPATVAEQGEQVTLTKVDSRDVDGKTEISVEGTNPILQYTSFQLTEPLRLVIDIAGSNIGKLPDKIAVNSGGATDIVPSQKDNIARLEIGISEAVE